MVIFNSYVKLPEGRIQQIWTHPQNNFDTLDPKKKLTMEFGIRNTMPWNLKKKDHDWLVVWNIFYFP